MRDFQSTDVGRAWQMPRDPEPAVRRITAEILWTLTGQKPTDLLPTTPHILTGDDAFATATSGSVIWGAGLASPGAPVPPLHAQQIIAVRGMATADRLVGAGIRLRNIALGDPGLLAASLLGPDEVSNEVPITVVPDVSEAHHPFFRTVSRRSDVEMVDLGEDSLKPLRQIASSTVVVSQSLHGLVYAEAFGKPSVWIASRSDAEHDFRFQDWFSTVFEKTNRPLAIGGSLDRMVSEARRSGYARAVADLVAPFPEQNLG